MTQDQWGHECSYYCQDGVHAYKVATDPTVTRDELLQTITLAFPDWYVLDAIQAREAPAPLGRWLDQLIYQVSPDGTLYEEPLLRNHTQPWLVLVRHREEYC